MSKKLVEKDVLGLEVVVLDGRGLEAQVVVVHVLAGLVLEGSPFNGLQEALCE